MLRGNTLWRGWIMAMLDSCNLHSLTGSKIKVYRKQSRHRQSISDHRRKGKKKTKPPFTNIVANSWHIRRPRDNSISLGQCEISAHLVPNNSNVLLTVIFYFPQQHLPEEWCISLTELSHHTSLSTTTAITRSISRVWQCKHSNNDATEEGSLKVKKAVSLVTLGIGGYVRKKVRNWLLWQTLLRTTPRNNPARPRSQQIRADVPCMQAIHVNFPRWTTTYFDASKASFLKTKKQMCALYHGFWKAFKLTVV